MPRYYIDFLGGAQRVRMLVGLAPSNYGTTLGGLVNYVSDYGLLGLTTSLLTPWCEACVQQFQGSSFLTNLNAGGGTEPGVKYVDIASRYDDVISPYTNSFLSGANVHNITIQDQCPQDDDSHLALPYDSNVMQDVVNALGPDSPTFEPTCSSSGWLTGDL